MGRSETKSAVHTLFIIRILNIIISNSLKYINTSQEKQIMNRFIWILASALLLIGLSSCSSLKLETGEYVMSVKLPSESESVPKTVTLTVIEDKVTIQQPGDERIITGSRKGNRFTAHRSKATERVEFTGVLKADNTVEGNVIQKSGDEIVFSTTFTLVKIGQQKKQE